MSTSCDRDHDTEDPLPAILKTRITLPRIEGILADPTRSPNITYTLRPGYRPLAQLGLAARAYIQQQQGTEPSALRLPPAAFYEVVPELVPVGKRREDPEFCYFLDGQDQIPVFPYHGLQQNQVECIGRSRTSPRLPTVTITHTDEQKQEPEGSIDPPPLVTKDNAYYVAMIRTRQITRLRQKEWQTLSMSRKGGLMSDDTQRTIGEAPYPQADRLSAQTGPTH